MNYVFKDSLNDLNNLDYTADYAELTKGGGYSLDITLYNRGKEALVNNLASI